MDRIGKRKREGGKEGEGEDVCGNTRKCIGQQLLELG